MKTKNYVADFNAIVVAKFDYAEITLRYPNAHKEEGKKGALYAMITEGADFICVGTLAGKYVIGVRPSGQLKFQVLAVCKNKAFEA